MDSGLGLFYSPFGPGMDIHITPESIFTSHRNEYSHAPDSALQTADEDQRTMAKWRARTIGHDALLEWVDTDVYDKWGLKGAVRVLEVSRSGWDAEPKGDLKNKRPSDVATEQTIQVPGIDPPVETAFGVSQALTWVAGQRTELQEDLEWRSQVPELMALLLKRSPSGSSLFAQGD